MHGLLVTSKYHLDMKPLKSLISIANDSDDIDVVAKEDVSIGIYDNEFFIKLSDERVLHEGDVDIPDWAVLYGVGERLTKCFERLGIRCFSSSEMTSLAKDKILSSALMSSVFPSPDSLFYCGSMDILSVVPDGRSFMLKDARGNKGTSVWKIDVPSEALKLIEEHNAYGRRMIFQQLMPKADDVRVYIVNGEVIFPITRKVPAGVWRTNLDSSPVQKPYMLNDEQFEMIYDGIGLLPKDHGLITFDFLFGKGGELRFCEMNTSPGFQALRNLGKEEYVAHAYFDSVRRIVSES